MKTGNSLRFLKGLSILIPTFTVCQMQYVYAAKYMEVQEAQKSMFKNADSFVDVSLTLSKEQKKNIKKHSGINEIQDNQQIWKALQGKNHVGYFVIDYVYGKHEFITYAIALDMKGVVMSIDILEYKESYGGEVKNIEWRKQFTGKTIKDNFTVDDDIKNITDYDDRQNMIRATLSCKHIADGVKKVLSIYELYIKN